MKDLTQRRSLKKAKNLSKNLEKNIKERRNKSAVNDKSLSNTVCPEDKEMAEIQSQCVKKKVNSTRQGTPS